jgi:hypothetical protein
MSVDAKMLTVVNAIKQSLQMSGGPGSSVNTHPNPFFMNVTGEINLKHMAELVVTRVEEYETLIKAKVEAALAAVKNAEAEAAKRVEADAAAFNAAMAKGVAEVKAAL